MQHRLISYENACELIDHLDAVEILSAGSFQAFTSSKGAQQKFILLTGTSECLVIENPVNLRLVSGSDQTNAKQHET
jgi:hypothetical protein